MGIDAAGCEEVDKTRGSRNAWMYIGSGRRRDLVPMTQAEDKTTRRQRRGPLQGEIRPRWVNELNFTIVGVKVQES